MHHTMKAWGEVEVLFHLFVISALNRGEWSDSHPGTFIPREVLIELEPWWVPEPVWSFRREKISCLILVSFPQLPDQLWAQHSLLHIAAVRRTVKQSTNATGHLSVRNAVALRGFNPDAPWFIFSLCLVKGVGFFTSIYFMVITIKLLPVPMAAWS
jgi:hypothetical protein